MTKQIRFFFDAGKDLGFYVNAIDSFIGLHEHFAQSSSILKGKKLL
jgi:hypothetical protein